MTKSTPHTIVLLIICMILRFLTASGIEEPKLKCNVAEKAALLDIKDSLYVRTPNLEIVEPETVLWSWGKEDEKRECCEWIGIRCDNKTGRVTVLDLSPSSLKLEYVTFLGGNISSSLADLHYLNYLDLSEFIHDTDSIPSFIGNLSKLRYLNLSSIYLSGEVPSELGNLSSLQVLDLSGVVSSLEISRLEWASRLSSLEKLYLSSVFMDKAEDWLRVVTSLPSLTDLRLSSCVLPNVVAPKSLSNSYLNSIAILDLSFNTQISNSTFTWLFNYSHSLVHLDLYGCGFELPSIPEAFGNMASVSYLRLGNNLFKGSIPESLGNMTSLTYLDLSGNRLEGLIPKSFGNLASLEHLDLHYNMLEGNIPKSIWEICTLRYFDAADNKLSGQLELSASSSRCGNFSLEFIDLSHNRVTGPLANFTLYPSLKELHLFSNQLNGDVSESIGQLTKLEVLDISQNMIRANMSKDHFVKLVSLSHLDLSSNSHIALTVPSDWIPSFNLEHINLGSCKMGPNFPSWLRTQTNYSELNISKSGISDSIPLWFWNLPAHLVNLDMSNNEITGTILDQNHTFTFLNVEIDLSSNKFEGSLPLFLLQVNALNLFQNRFSDLNSICEIATSTSLRFLDVSYNKLSGKIPDCWSRMNMLETLTIGNNNLTGQIPVSIGSLTSVKTLHLANNKLSGEIPLALESCTKLLLFDVGGNRLTGEIPKWIGETTKDLVILSLRSNSFEGNFPSNLCQLGNLQVLDLSSNSLSGTIPTCVSNITAMRRVESVDSSIMNFLHLYENRGYPGFLYRYNDKLSAQWKGSLSELQNLGLFKNLDLSSNEFSGEIPTQITELIGLVSLNLSRNNLSGQIPREIGKLKSLDALDLSKNRLYGRIPSSLSQIDRLSALDLSTNNLSGKIPTGVQIQNRNASAYMDNPELCGAPLPKKCPGEEKTTTVSESTNQESSKEDKREEDEIITKGFYISMAIGFVFGFWGIACALTINKPWRLLRIRLKS